MATRLSAHFTLEELTRSATASALKLDNTPTDVHKAHLQELVTNLLEPLRVAWGDAIIITSGYRGFRLNQAVGGAKASAHGVGYAADMKPKNGRMAEFKPFVRRWLRESGVKYDQFIDEKKGASEWVHLGIKSQSGKQRKQDLLYRGGVYTIMKKL